MDRRVGKQLLTVCKRLPLTPLGNVFGLPASIFLTPTLYLLKGSDRPAFGPFGLVVMA